MATQQTNTCSKLKKLDQYTEYIQLLNVSVKTKELCLYRLHWIYLSVNLEHSITCRGRRMFRIVMQIIKILKTFIEGSVFVLLSIVCFCFRICLTWKVDFFWFSWSKVFHVYILHCFNVSTMRASTLLSVQWFFSYKRNLKKWKNGKQKKRDK